MKKIQDNQGQVKVFLQKSRTIQGSFENPGHSRTFHDSGHHGSSRDCMEWRTGYPIELVHSYLGHVFPWSYITPASIFWVALYIYICLISEIFREVFGALVASHTHIAWVICTTWTMHHR